MGLGNPGPQYEMTRHNAGFAFLDAFAERHAVAWQRQSQFEGLCAELVVSGRKLFLVKPQSYMNRSGSSVAKMMRYFKLAPEQVLVAHDELELPEGEAKLKFGGGHAGHNGLRDIIAHIESRDFYRLRLGIGRPPEGRGVADYVLSRPSASGLALARSTIDKALSIEDLLLAVQLDRFNQDFAALK